MVVLRILLQECNHIIRYANQYMSCLRDVHISCGGCTPLKYHIKPRHIILNPGNGDVTDYIADNALPVFVPDTAAFPDFIEMFSDVPDSFGQTSVILMGILADLFTITLFCFFQ